MVNWELAETPPYFPHDRIINDSVSEGFKCPVCLQVLEDPVALMCGHIFDLRCLHRGQDMLPCCPLDRKETFGTYSHLTQFRQTIREVVMTRCTACEETMPVDRLHHHITDECRNARMSCGDCGDEGPALHTPSHTIRHRCIEASTPDPQAVMEACHELARRQVRLDCADEAIGALLAAGGDGADVAAALGQLLSLGGTGSKGDVVGFLERADAALEAVKALAMANAPLVLSSDKLLRRLIRAADTSPALLHLIASGGATRLMEMGVYSNTLPPPLVAALAATKGEALGRRGACENMVGLLLAGDDEPLKAIIGLATDNRDRLVEAGLPRLLVERMHAKDPRTFVLLCMATVAMGPGPMGSAGMCEAVLGYGSMAHGGFSVPLCTDALWLCRAVRALVTGSNANQRRCSKAGVIVAMLWLLREHWAHREVVLECWEACLALDAGLATHSLRLQRSDFHSSVSEAMRYYDDDPIVQGRACGVIATLASKNARYRIRFRIELVVAAMRRFGCRHAVRAARALLNPDNAGLFGRCGGCEAVVGAVRADRALLPDALVLMARSPGVGWPAEACGVVIGAFQDPALQVRCCQAISAMEGDARQFGEAGACSAVVHCLASISAVHDSFLVRAGCSAVAVLAKDPENCRELAAMGACDAIMALVRENQMPFLRAVEALESLSREGANAPRLQAAGAYSAIVMDLSCFTESALTMMMVATNKAHLVRSGICSRITDLLKKHGIDIDGFIAVLFK